MYVAILAERLGKIQGRFATLHGIKLRGELPICGLPVRTIRTISLCHVLAENLVQSSDTAATGVISHCQFSKLHCYVARNVSDTAVHGVPIYFLSPASDCAANSSNRLRVAGLT